MKPPRLKYTASRPLSDEDRLLFRETVVDVVPFTPPNTHALSPLSKRLLHPHRPKPHSHTIQTKFALSAPDWVDGDSLEGGLHYRHNGVDKRMLKALQRGAWPITAELDLHGITQEEARLKLDLWLQYCIEAKHRAIQIIHGRGLRSPSGKAALRPLVRHWLTQIPAVLAFCDTAREGAVLVLLRQA